MTSAHKAPKSEFRWLTKVVRAGGHRYERLLRHIQLLYKDVVHDSETVAACIDFVGSSVSVGIAILPRQIFDRIDQVQTAEAQRNRLGQKADKSHLVCQMVDGLPSIACEAALLALTVSSLVAAAVICDPGI